MENHWKSPCFWAKSWNCCYICPQFSIFFHRFPICGFPQMGDPQNGRFIVYNLNRWLRGTPMSRNIHFHTSATFPILFPSKTSTAGPPPSPPRPPWRLRPWRFFAVAAAASSGPAPAAARSSPRSPPAAPSPRPAANSSKTACEKSRAVLGLEMLKKEVA